MLYQEIDGKMCEPVERLVVDVPSDSVGAVIEKIGARKGDLLEMTPVGDRMKLEFLVPSAACSATATSSSPTPRARASWLPSLRSTLP